MRAADDLVCPSCGRERPRSERFCEACGMPLVQRGAGEQRAGARRRVARKIKPQYAEGELVRVARARTGAEAELIAGMLLEEGIPSVVRTAFGAPFGVYAPAVSPQDVLVPASGAEAALEALSYERPEQADGHGPG
jgi:hypothetical protein